MGSNLAHPGAHRKVQNIPLEIGVYFIRSELLWTEIKLLNNLTGIIYALYLTSKY